MKSKMLLCPVCQKSHYHELSGRGMCSSCAHIHRERIRRLCPVCQKRVFNPAPGREACSSCAASQPLNPNASEQVTRQRSDQVTRILQFEAVLLDPHGTLQEVATQLGISRERVRQIISTYPELAHLRSVCRINARKILKEEIKDDKLKGLAKKAQIKDELAMGVVDLAISAHISVNQAVKKLGCSVTRGLYNMYRVRSGAKLNPHRTSKDIKKFMKKLIALLPGVTVSKAIQMLGKTTGERLFYSKYCAKLRLEDPEFRNLAEEAKRLEYQSRDPQANHFDTPLPVTKKLQKALRSAILEDHVTLSDFARAHNISAWHARKIYTSLRPDEELEDALAFVCYQRVSELHKKRKF